MKTFYTVILSALICTIANGQCNTSMAGTFIQRDSCNGYSQYQSTTISIVSGTGTDIIIQHFDDIFPYYDATVTLDCSNHTVVMPTQYPGMITIWGSGTFSSDYNYMTFNYSVDFGSYTKTCVAKYYRQGYGIFEAKSEQYHLDVFPNPFSTYTTLQSDISFKNATLMVYNSLGQVVKKTDNLSGQTIIFYRDNLPGGLYFICLMQDNKTFMADKLVITDN